MGWKEWIDLDTIKACGRHATGAVGAVLIFLAIRLVIKFGVKEGTLQDILETIDSFVLVGLFLWIAFQTGVILWNRRIRIEKAVVVLVV